MLQHLESIWATVDRPGILTQEEVVTLGIPIVIHTATVILTHAVVGTATRTGTRMGVIAGTGAIVAARLLHAAGATPLNTGAAGVIQEVLLGAAALPGVVAGIMMHPLHLLHRELLRRNLAGNSIILTGLRCVPAGY